jgi:hypothetical protein
MLRHGADGFTSSPKEGVLRNFIALKHDSVGFEPAALMSSGKYTNHYTTEETKQFQPAGSLCVWPTYSSSSSIPLI